MHTLVDFITHVKGIEYLLSVLFIGGFLLLWEILKPQPFAAVVSAGKKDLEHIKRDGYRETMKFAGKIAAAPFIGLLYIVMLPVGFFFMVLSEVVNHAVNGVSTLLGKDVSFAWNPVEAYFTGRKRKQAKADTGKSETR